MVVRDQPTTVVIVLIDVGVAGLRGGLPIAESEGVEPGVKGHVAADADGTLSLIDRAARFLREEMLEIFANIVGVRVCPQSRLSGAGPPPWRRD